MKEDKFKIETNTGEILIGTILEFDSIPFPKIKSMQSLFSDHKHDGIWLKRERHLSYLSKENIKEISKAGLFDKEC